MLNYIKNEQKMVNIRAVILKQTDNTILVLVDFSVSCPPDIKLQFTEI